MTLARPYEQTSGVAEQQHEPEQLDFVQTADELKEYQRSLRAAVQRVTIKEVAYDLNLAPESLEHQLKRWDRRKRPSADCAFVCLKRDMEHRNEVLASIGYVCAPRPRLTVREAMRALTERAGAKGYVSAPEIAQLLAQTDFGGIKP